MTGLRVKCLTGTAIAIGLAAAANSADAQQAATPASSNNQGVQEVIVTALKRESSLERTPAKVDVVSADELIKHNVTNIANLANLEPSLNFGMTNGIYTLVTIRGVSSQDTGELGNPAATFSVDGETINRPLNLAASLFDVGRIEVLRGPQGTLYGRNATAGAVSIITARPNDELSGYVTADYGNYNQRGIQGFINIPVKPGLLDVRIAAIGSAHDGYTKTEKGRVLDDSDVAGERIRVLFTPGNRFSLLVTGEEIRTDGGGPGTVGVFATGTAGTIPINSAQTPPSRDQTIVGMNPRLSTIQKDIRAETSYDLGFATVTDVVGDRRTSFQQFQNFSGTPTWGIDYQGHATYDTFSNELRVSSPKNSPINWQAGYYYFDEVQTVNSAVYVGLPFAIRDVTKFLYFIYPSVEEVSHGYFGEATVPLGHGVSLTAGARYSDDHKTRVGTQYALNSGAFLGTGGAVVSYVPGSVNGDSRDHKLTYNIVLGWQATEDNYLYGKVSTGFKSGGFTTTNTYGPESLTAFEAGTKNRLMQNRLQLNADAFYYEYRDQQVNTFDSGSGLPTTENAGRSRIWGLEADATAKLTPQDQLKLSADYLDAKFTQFLAVATTYGGATAPLNLAGAPLPFSPKWTFAASITHTIDLSWGHVTLEANTAYKSSYYTAVFPYKPLRQDAYTSTSLLVQYQTLDRAWSVEGYINNIENTRPMTNGMFGSRGPASYFFWQFGAPMTAGVRLSYRFH